MALSVPVRGPNPDQHLPYTNYIHTYYIYIPTLSAPIQKRLFVARMHTCQTSILYERMLPRRTLFLTYIRGINFYQVYYNELAT